MSGMADTRASARLLLLAIVAGTAMASNYVLQPVLPAVARSFPASPWITSLAAGAGPLGYMLGLVLLVPLGDGLPVRTLVAVQAAALAALLVLAAVTTIEPLFLAALLLGGMASTVTAQCVALAGRVCPTAQGRAVGTVVMGVSAGILGGRVLSGALATSFGWRGPLAVIAVLTALGSLGIVIAVPAMPASGTRMRLPDLLLAVPRAYASNSELRRATLVGCCWFAAFSSFWTAISLHLALPPLSKGAAFAGGFGLFGIAGAIAAQLAGRASDRWGERRVVFAGLVGALLGFVILCLSPASLAGLALGALVMDAGCFGAQAATQGYILRTGGDERSRRYSAYMTVYWSAGALGSFVAPALFRAGGWPTLNLVNAMLIAIGMIFHARKHQLDKA
ncbi:MAG: hypothetical protein DI547_15725 [Sphingobium sp.]|nr:MAG: hypothetical protein DI547_15725 [Sphingobium sp.]